MDIKRLKSIIDHFNTARILVIGDLILDRFIRGDLTQISDEAPVPVVDITSEIVRPGGAANAISNIIALGGSVRAVGVIGDDPEGRTLVKLLSQGGVSTDGILISNTRPTTVKTRVIAEKNQQHLMRIDRQIDSDIPPDQTRQILDYVKSCIGEVDAILISDYDKGVITDNLLEELIPYIRQSGKPIVVDSKVEHFLDYRDVTLVKVSYQVASLLTGVAQINETSIRNIGQWMLTQLEPEYMLITRGKNGMTLFSHDGDVMTIPSIAKEVREVVGVADTVTAVIALSLAVNNVDTREAAVLANTTAGIVVGKLGSATVTREELVNYLEGIGTTGDADLASI